MISQATAPPAMPTVHDIMQKDLVAPAAMLANTALKVIPVVIGVLVVFWALKYALSKLGFVQGTATSMAQGWKDEYEKHYDLYSEREWRDEDRWWDKHNTDTDAHLDDEGFAYYDDARGRHYSPISSKAKARRRYAAAHG